MRWYCDDLTGSEAFYQGQIDLDELVDHFNKLVDYDVAENRIRPHIDSFQEMLKEKGLL